MVGIMLKIRFTFDYEIHFGKNNESLDKILFEPTNQILDVLDKYNIKAIFFVDTLCYYKMMELNKNDFCEKMKNQCIDMMKRGHDVQLHIHAHWLSSHFIFPSSFVNNSIINLSKL